MTDDLVQWLGEQLDEDERIARDAASHAASALATRDRKIDRYSPPYDGSHWSNDYDHVFATDHRVDSRRIAEIADCGYSAFMLTPHIAAHDPARVLREIDAKRRLLADFLAEPHFRNEEDNWYTCAALVDEDGEPVCIDESRAPGPCDCGRDARVRRRAGMLTQPYADRPGYREEWRP